uniref:(California timema) hypothetical protein n=1 Tax=Timema californicum TaxID=61474 RepID=A0A7R9P9A9_TIMCA|nr:unnamed protein product [Timema californicum]
MRVSNTCFQAGVVVLLMLVVFIIVVLSTVPQAGEDINTIGIIVSVVVVSLVCMLACGPIRCDGHDLDTTRTLQNPTSWLGGLSGDDHYGDSVRDGLWGSAAGIVELVTLGALIMVSGVWNLIKYPDSPVVGACILGASVLVSTLTYLRYFRKERRSSENQVFVQQSLTQPLRLSQQVTWRCRGKVSDFCAGAPGFNPRSRHRFI